MFYLKSANLLMLKHHLNIYCTEEYLLQYPILLPYTCIPSSSTAGLLLHLQHYQRCEPMMLEMWVKSKFVLFQPRYYSLLIEKTYKKIHAFEVLIFSGDVP